jgi:PAS domain S-box-containing protein
VLGKDDFELMARDYAEAYRVNDLLTLEAGMVEIPAEPVWTASGHQMWFKTTKAAIVDEDGTPVYLLGYAENVTERRHAEEALRESEEHFRSLLANVPGAVYHCQNDDLWTMEFVSGGIEDILGYPASDFVGNAVRDYLSVIHPDDRQLVEERTAGAIRRREPLSVEYRVVDREGGTRWVQERGRGIVDVDGAVRLMDGLILDINDRKQAEAERDRMEQDLRLAHKLEAVGQLAAGIAHEINTPVQFVGDTVTFVKEAAEDLLRLVERYRRVCAASAEGPVDPALLEEVERLESEVDLAYLEERLPSAFERAFDGIERVSTIVKGMKGFAWADRGEPEPADLNQAIRNTVVVASNEWKYVARVDLQLAELPPIRCHVGDLNQVFLNLIVNAAHAIGEVPRDDGLLGTIRIATALADADSVVVTVEDDGPGIPEEIRDRVFDPFFTTKEVGKGTGQGLALARSIVDRHGGLLAVESEAGRGTAFTITLPVGGPSDHGHVDA